jgi:hypothetical protein
VTTSADYTGPVDVCIGYGGADYTGLTPRLFRLNGGVWSDVTTRLDPSSQTVCGRVTSLSPFVVFGDEPPTVSLPAGITVDARAPGGAIVDFSASATDGADPAPALTCAPEADTTFPIGDTTVTCTAADNAGNTATGSFVVHVRGAAEQLDRLIALVRGAGLDKPLADDLLRRLNSAVTDLGKPAKCARDLDRFRARAFKELGKGNSSLTVTTAGRLLAATTIERALGRLDADSPVPLAEHDTLGLFDAINGMSLAPGYADDLRDRAAAVGVAWHRAAPPAPTSRSMALHGRSRAIRAGTASSPSPRPRHCRPPSRRSRTILDSECPGRTLTRRPSSEGLRLFRPRRIGVGLRRNDVAPGPIPPREHGLGRRVDLDLQRVSGCDVWSDVLFAPLFEAA